MDCPSETRLQAFVEGDLDEAAIPALSEHLDGCADCRVLVGAVQPVGVDDDEADRIGRFVLRRVLGRGGMGVVYEAVDPELHRIVAVKVLRGDLGIAEDRLLAEARAMALLSHPNVVTIHDVGRIDGRVFLVMTLVDGISLRQWLARGAHTPGAILDAFLQAGEGLGAAHDAGLVHRDFKPENVFVAIDGRVLVGDFGLALGLGADGAAEGSLAYMAPEQRAGEKVDARSDQYSFCVALDEALRPSPRAVARLLARGRTAAPEGRHASMRVLLDGLRATRRRSPARVVVPVVVLAALVAGGVLLARARTTAATIATCRAQEKKMTDTWSDAARARTAAAFRTTGSPLAEAAWKNAHTALDAYAEAWRGAQQRTCEAPLPRDAVFERKETCLDERLEVTRAVVDGLGRVDSAALELVPSTIALLPRVATCEDPRALASQPPPPSAEKAVQVDAVRKKVAIASATIAAGHYADGRALADTAWHEASSTGYLPVLADAYLWLGTAQGRLGQTAESEQALTQAAAAASAGHAPATAVRAWVQLMHFVGFEGHRYDDGARYAEYSATALESLPGAWELQTERLTWERAMLLDRKRFDEALGVSRRELALVEQHFGPTHRLAAAALDGLASGLAGQCHPRDAREPQERSCAILEEQLGPAHPQLALCLGNLATLHASLGDHEAALALKTRALGMFVELPGHPNHIAMTRRNLVRSLVELGRFPEAAAELQRASAASQSAADAASIVLLRATLERREGKVREALVDAAAAVAQTATADPARRVEPLVALAETQLFAERWSDASASATEAVALATAVHGEGTCRTAEPLRVLAEAMIGSGRGTEAHGFAERAVRASATAQLDPAVQERLLRTLGRTR